MNQFRDNPYESPVLAELSERPVCQPPRPKRWTPYGSFIFALFGPIAFIVLIRYMIHEWKVIDQDDPLRYFALATAAFVWLVAIVRSAVWVVGYSWR